MPSMLRRGRTVGLLLLGVFALGVVNFQVLQSSVLAGSAHVAEVPAHAPRIVASVFVSLLGGALSVGVAVLLIPVFRRVADELAFGYLAFVLVTFVAIAIDTVSVASVLEVSRAVASESGASEGSVVLAYGRHFWTHHLYLLLSCLPVLLFFTGLYLSRAVPKALSLFGIVAAVLMGVEMVGVIAGVGVSEWLFVPIALVQVATPLWLLAKGFRGEDADPRHSSAAAVAG